MNTEYLAHHGVKGMKWGVRKKYEGSNTSGSISRRERKTLAIKSAHAEKESARDSETIDSIRKTLGKGDKAQRRESQEVYNSTKSALSKNKALMSKAMSSLSSKDLDRGRKAYEKILKKNVLSGWYDSESGKWKKYTRSQKAMNRRTAKSFR